MSLDAEALQALETRLERVVQCAAHAAVAAAFKARDEAHAAGTCDCGLDPAGRRLVGRLAEAVTDMGRGDVIAGVEELRENHQLVSSMRRGMEAGRLAAIRAVVAGVLAAIAAGLWMLVAARAGN